MAAATLDHNATVSLTIHLLGVPRVVRDAQVAPPPRGHKVWGLLSYLVCTGVPVSRPHLATLLFSEADDPLAALRWNLSELRRLLGEVGLRGEMLGLELPVGTSVDVNILVAGAWSEALRLPHLGGELLEGMNFAGSPAFDVWLAAERRRVTAATEAVLHEAALARLAVAQPAEAAQLAGRLVTLNPLDENYQALLVRSLASAGDGIGAARQAAACTDLFRRELGVSPGPALAAAIRTATASPVARPATGRPAVLAQLEAGEAAVRAGAHEAGLQCLRRAIVDADAVGDTALRVRARVALGGALVHAARGCDEEGATALHEALAVAEAASLPQAAGACRELGYVEFLRGRYDRALVWLQRATASADEDLAEQAGIAIVHGATLTDTAYYSAAIAKLDGATALAERAGDLKQQAYALSMLGRAHLLRGDLEAAAEPLDRSIRLARANWMAFLPWPQSLRAEIDLLRGDLASAAEQFEHAFALGCQMGDPCWEGIAGRGLGCIAMAQGKPGHAVDILTDTVRRSGRLPDAYLWGKAYALDVLCGLSVAEGLPQAGQWIDELQMLAARSGMRELVARAHLHRARFGDAASGLPARLLAQEIDNPVLWALVERDVTAG